MDDAERHLMTTFSTALEYAPGEERDAYLAAACAGRPSLRARVEDLLRAHERAGDFLGPGSVVLAETRPETPGARASADDATEEPGARIGPYRILEPIGEGGMGVVYMAEQATPVRRMVALKVVKAGMDSRQVLARFEAERQAIALMDHPNIAKVLDAGATEHGRPYFVMELVKGVPITRFCDERRLTPRERLELFIPVCQAVQHAHQKGIIHRDLKPSNVLVALYDGKPVPKVIDFGVAKATGQRLTEATLFTGFGAVVGTPEYMSPEQAELNQLDIDTRSDIYALGVLLYELLTGSTPLDRRRLKEAAILEVLRVIREEEPPRPSTRLSTTEELPSIAACRNVEPRKLTGLVRGELDWIVMKALEKDRGRRYETANGLAADVRRHLDDEPVQACPPSAWYRLRKFVRRNRRVLGTAAVAALALSVGVGSLLSVQIDRYTRSLRLTGEVSQVLRQADALYEQSELQEALTEARIAKGLLRNGDVPAELSREVERRLADLEMAIRLEELRLGWLGYRDAASNYADCDRALRDYGIDIDALPQEEAVARIKASRIKLDLVYALSWWAGLLDSDPRNRDLARCQQLRDLARLSDDDPSRTRARAATRAKDVRALRDLVAEADLDGQQVRSLTTLAASLWGAGDPESSIVFLKRIQRRFPSDYQANTLLANYLMSCKPPRYYEAVGYCRAALALRPRRAQPYDRLALCLNNLGDWDGAAAAAREAIRLAPLGDHSHKFLAYALQYQGDLAGARAAIREAIRLRPESALYRKDHGDILLDAGELDAALEEYRAADRLKPDDAATLSGLAAVYLTRGLAKGDEALVDEAWVTYQRAEKIQPEHVRTCFGLCIIRYVRGDREVMLSALRSFARAHPEVMTEADFYAQFAHHLNGIAWLLANAEDPGMRSPACAVKLAEEVVQLAAGEPAYWNTLGVARYRAGDWSRAIPDLEKAMSLGRGGDATDMLFMAMAHGRLGQLEKAQERYEQAVEWMGANMPIDAELIRLRAEASELLGDAQEPMPSGKEALVPET